MDNHKNDNNESGRDISLSLVDDSSFSFKTPNSKHGTNTTFYIHCIHLHFNTESISRIILNFRIYFHEILMNYNLFIFYTIFITLKISIYDRFLFSMFVF